MPSSLSERNIIYIIIYRTSYNMFNINRGRGKQECTKTGSGIRDKSREEASKHHRARW